MRDRRVEGSLLAEGADVQLVVDEGDPDRRGRALRPRNARLSRTREQPRRPSGCQREQGSASLRPSVENEAVVVASAGGKARRERPSLLALERVLPTAQLDGHAARARSPDPELNLLVVEDDRAEARRHQHLWPLPGLADGRAPPPHRRDRATPAGAPRIRPPSMAATLVEGRLREALGTALRRTCAGASPCADWALISAGGREAPETHRPRPRTAKRPATVAAPGVPQTRDRQRVGRAATR